MNFNLLETLFEDFKDDTDELLNEELSKDIDGQEILYEDDDYSKTPEEADRKRETAEEVLGFSLNSNQVQYLATYWAEFYQNAKENSDMRDIILTKMEKAGLLENQPNIFDAETDYEDDDELDTMDISGNDSIDNDSSAFDDDLPDGSGVGDMSFELPTDQVEQIKSSEQQMQQPVEQWSEKQTVTTQDDINNYSEEDFGNEFVDVGDDIDDTDVDRINGILSGGN